MRRLCQMKKLLAILFAGSISGQAAQSFFSELKYQHADAPLSLTSESSGHDLDSYTSKFGYRRSYGAWTSEASLNLIRSDYRNIVLKNRAQQPFGLSHARPVESSFDLTQSFDRGPRGSSLNVFTYLSQSPYATQGFRLNHYESFYNKSTVVGLTLGALKQRAPEDFFVDKDFVVKARPQRIHAVEVSPYVEQSLSERYKIRLKGLYAQRREERPPQWGVRLLQAFAFTDRLFSQFELGYLRESHRTGLKNERGYFDARFLKIQGSWEIVYDVVGTLSYGLVSEVENDPRSKTKVRIGSDQYALAFNYEIAGLKIKNEASYYATNSTTRGYSFLGGIEWPW